MKRILSILLCVLTIFSLMLFSSCADSSSTDSKQNTPETPTFETLNGKTPLELYSATAENVESANGISFSTVLVMEIITEGKEPTVYNQSVSVSTDHAGIHVKAENDRYPETNAELWFVNETLYLSTVAGNFKQSLSFEEYHDRYAPDGSDPESILVDCPESWFKNAEFTKEDLETYCLEFKVSGKEYWESIKDGMITSEVMSLAVKNVDYKVYFDDNGELKKIVTEFEISFGQITTRYTSTTVVELAAEVEVSAPEGSDTWQDLSTLPEQPEDPDGGNGAQ